MIDKSLDEFENDRNTALFSFNKEKILAYMDKYNITPATNEKAFWDGVCISVLQISTAPANIKEKAKEMLKK